MTDDFVTTLKWFLSIQICSLSTRNLQLGIQEPKDLEAERELGI